MEVDFDAPDTPNLIPNGIYPAKIARAEERTTKNGDPKMTLQIKITSGLYAGRVVWDDLLSTPSCMWKVRAVCSQLGIDTTGRKALTPDLFEGKTFAVKIKQDDYNGSVKNKVDGAGYLPLDLATGPERMEDPSFDAPEDGMDLTDPDGDEL